jgi:4a-hydroxytetrahydrobiopterin dehydratase
MPDYVRVPAHEIASRVSSLGGDWHVVRGHELEREWRFPDFAAALAFTNAVGAAAEELNHHPEIELGWGRVKLRIWTHAVSALTEHDFELAKRIGAIATA